MSYLGYLPDREGKQNEVEIPRPCPNCGHSDFDGLLWMEDDQGEITDWVRCCNCGWEYVDTMATGDGT